MLTAAYHTLLTTLVVPIAHAQDGIIVNRIPGCDFANGNIEPKCIPNFIAHLIEQVFMFTGAIALVMIIVGGYQYALGRISGGKDKAQATIRWGLIGFAVSALSFFIIDFVISTLAGL